MIRVTCSINRTTKCLTRCFIYRNNTTLVPDKPTWQYIDETKLPEEQQISEDLVNHLERLSLVDFRNQEAVVRLATAVRFADQVTTVDTTGVTPMYTVLENESLYLRSDEVRNNENRKSILKNAPKTEDNYFVAPPGNIPLTTKKKEFLQKIRDS